MINCLKKKNCVNCGKLFMAKNTAWHIRNGRGKYCSRQCSINGQKNRVNIVCRTCSKIFEVPLSRLAKAKYCSYKCGCIGSIGLHGYWNGKNRPKEKMGNAVKTMFKTEDVIGKNNKNWRGGITEANWSLRRTSKYLKFRQEVLTRDNHKCIWCGSSDNLTIDHIKPFSVFKELRIDISNARTLCRSCHIKTPTWGGRADKYSIKGGGIYA